VTASYKLLFLESIIYRLRNTLNGNRPSWSFDPEPAQLQATMLLHASVGSKNLVGGPSASARRARLHGPVYRRRVILRGVLPREEKPPIVVRRLESVQAMGGPGIEADPAVRVRSHRLGHGVRPPPRMVNIGRRFASLSVHGFEEPHYVLCPLFVRISFAPPSIIDRPPSTCRCKVYSANQSFPPTIRVVVEEPAQGTTT
jgi:hypothetical protein